MYSSEDFDAQFSFKLWQYWGGTLMADCLPEAEKVAIDAFMSI